MKRQEVFHSTFVSCRPPQISPQISISSDRLQMIADHLDELLDLFCRELAIFSENQSAVFVKGENVTAVVGNLPGIHQDFLLIPNIDGCRIALLFILEGRRNGKIGKPGCCHVNDSNLLKLIARKFLSVHSFAGIVVRILFIGVDVKKDVDLSP